MSEKRMKLIRESLEKLSPSCVELEDEGDLHVGHAGAKSGGHFKLSIVSESFRYKTTIERHRSIYKCLGDLMNTEVHAISIKAKYKDEA